MYPSVFFLSPFLAPRPGTAVLRGPCASAVLAPHPQLHQRQALGLASPGGDWIADVYGCLRIFAHFYVFYGSVHLEGWKALAPDHDQAFNDTQ